MSQLPKDDLYQILGLTPDAGQDAIDRAYKDLIRKTHPDLAKTPGEAEYRTTLSARINSAASILRDPDRRAAYDFDRRRAAEKAAQSAQRAATAATTATAAPQASAPAPAAHSAPAAAAAARRAHGARPAYRTASFDPADDPSFDDFFELHRRPAPSRRDRPPKSLTDWFIFNRVGQWLSVGLVGAVVFLIGNMLAARTGPLVAAAEVPILTTYAVAIWLVAGAVFTRDLQNPLGDLLRLAYRLMTWVYRLLGSDRASR